MTAIYLLELANRAYDLFKSSEIEERRQLLKLTLQNLVSQGKKVQFQVQKPFDTILNFADSPSWLAKWDDFRQADWSEIVDTPDLILQQTREFLQIASA